MAATEERQITKTEQIQARLQASTKFMEPFLLRARRNANRYLDGSATSHPSGAENAGGEGRDLPVGEVNYLAMNIRQKVAGMSIAAPDFYVTCGQDYTSELVRFALRDSWQKNNWVRLFQRVLTARFVQGMGFVAYLWDRQKGFQLEYLKADEVFFDPHTTDATWDNPRYGGYHIHLPYETAFARYGKEKFQQPQGASSDVEPVTVAEAHEQEKKNLKITLYWDELTEAHFYGNVLLEATPNFYKRVPIRTLRGDVNPNLHDEFPLSDYDTSLGNFEMLRRAQNIINNVASNGGGMLWINTTYVDEKQRNRIINGTHNGPLLVNGVPDGGKVMGYTENQQLSPALIEAIRMLSAGLDADQGVTEYDRGVIQSDPKFATQAALLQRSAGARGNLSRTQFEKFIGEIAKTFIELNVLFGLDPDGGPPTDEAVALWEAFKDVQDVRVIEESLAFKDPAMIQQQNMQLYDLAVQAAPVMAQQGFVPNFKLLFDDILRSFDRKNVEQYYIPLAPVGPVDPTGEAPQAGGEPTGEQPAPNQQDQSFV
jgi:hypothetical protein